MKVKYTYRIRPSYEGADLLVEFMKIGEPNNFLKELMPLLKDNGFQFDSLEDIWMNDEVWVHLNSENGSVLLTKDVWDMVFILAEKNQKDILRIDGILSGSESFKKEEVNFAQYK